MKQPFFRFLARLAFEIAIFVVVFISCNYLMTFLQLPIPAGILGLVLLLVVFALGWLKPEQLQLGAAFLMGEMLLFFIPALMSLLDYGEMVKAQGWKILLIIVVSTTLVMLTTATVVELIYRWNITRQRSK